MILHPFKHITGIPTGGRVRISDQNLTTFDLIDVDCNFCLEMIMAVKLPNFKGLSGYKFEGKLKFGFDETYRLIDVEFRTPFDDVEATGLSYKGVNLFQQNLSDVEQVLTSIGVPTDVTDVGLNAPTIGASFYAHEFEDNLDVGLDAVCITLKR